MREMAASEASRRFSAALDAAERGETIMVTRGGRRVALITPVTPAPRANGKALRDMFARWHGSKSLDDDFAANIAVAREVS